MTDRVFRLTLVRHGQTTHNKKNILQGQMDTQLTDLGREQAKLLGRYFAKHQIFYDQVFTSDLTRAYETCLLICDGRSNTINTSQLLRERSYGNLQGFAMERVRDMAYKLGYHQDNVGEFQPDGGESIEEVQQRVELFCREHLFTQVKDQQRILVVSHASTIREFTKLFGAYAHELKASDIVVTPNTGINSFDILLGADNEINQIRLIHLHQIPHLTFDVFNRDNPQPALENAKTLSNFAESRLPLPQQKF